MSLAYSLGSLCVIEQVCRPPSWCLSTIKTITEGEAICAIFLLKAISTTTLDNKIVSVSDHMQISLEMRREMKHTSIERLW